MSAHKRITIEIYGFTCLSGTLPLVVHGAIATEDSEDTAG